jgi:peroxiredoxin
VLEVGDTAPDFELPATGGSPVRLSEAAKGNRATVIAFYVLDFTPG